MEKLKQTKVVSRWRCFPVGLRPPFKHLHREQPCKSITKQYVKEHTYKTFNQMPYGTKLGAKYR